MSDTPGKKNDTPMKDISPEDLEQYKEIGEGGTKKKQEIKREK